MSWILHDPDEWEAKSDSKVYGRDPFGNLLGSCSYSLVRRSPESVAEIKAKKRREHEDSVLAEAAQIMARRGMKIVRVVKTERRPFVINETE